MTGSRFFRELVALNFRCLMAEGAWMTGSLSRRLQLAALLLVAVTLIAWLDLPATQLRDRILAILLALALATLGYASLVSRSLTLRVRRLKLLVEGFPGGAAKDRQAL